MLFSFTAFKNTLTSQITQCTAHVQTEDINYKDFIKQKTKKVIEKKCLWHTDKSYKPTYIFYLFGISQNNQLRRWKPRTKSNLKRRWGKIEFKYLLFNITKLFKNQSIIIITKSKNVRCS